GPPSRPPAANRGAEPKGRSGIGGTLRGVATPRAAMIGGAIAAVVAIVVGVIVAVGGSDDDPVAGQQSTSAAPGTSGSSPMQSLNIQTTMDPKDIERLYAAMPPQLRGAVTCEPGDMHKDSAATVNCKFKANEPLLAGLTKDTTSLSMIVSLASNPDDWADDIRRGTKKDLVEDDTRMVSMVVGDMMSYFNKKSGLSLHLSPFINFDAIKAFVARAGL
ncbi:MAG: hypothetical protein HOQ24_16705, partial [Mycobacteriaceae bacterium]|nr:hypothetical protein [Mycobacteriaceae bacterium]